MKTLAQRNRRMAAAVVMTVAGMVALAYASVPLYKLFCRVTGYDGTTQVAAHAPQKILQRKITIFFDARTDSGLPWEFAPEKRRVIVNVGQQGFISFQATSQSAQPTTGTALYNVTPDKAGKYFVKTQCFCFAQQRLAPGKTAHFPVVFFVDPKIADDPDMDDVTDITLSYTFYPANTPRFDQAFEKSLQSK